MHGRVNFSTLHLIYLVIISVILQFVPNISTVELLLAITPYPIFSPDVMRNNSLKSLFPGIHLEKMTSQK